jgi:hypothetical protein
MIVASLLTVAALVILVVVAIGGARSDQPGDTSQGSPYRGGVPTLADRSTSALAQPRRLPRWHWLSVVGFTPPWIVASVLVSRSQPSSAIGFTLDLRILIVVVLLFLWGAQNVVCAIAVHLLNRRGGRPLLTAMAYMICALPSLLVTCALVSPGCRRG